MAQISVPGASGTHLIFTVSGDSTTNYATAFAAAVNSAASSGNLTLNVVDGLGTDSMGSIVMNELVSGSATSFTPITGQYTVVDETATITGSAGGRDTVLAGSDTTFGTTGQFDATYVAVGSDNQITFINGDNTYLGSSGTGVDDTITAGAGNDFINTGHGSSTVFSGTGTSIISLNNTSGSDVVYLGDGTSTVLANGVNDVVSAAASGALIIGGSASSNLAVAITSTVTGAAMPAGDEIVARGQSTTVFDSVGGNTIYGGSGALTLIGQSGGLPVADTVLAGTGFTAISGFANADITFASTATNSNIAVVAGLGNETLNGANAGNFSLYASTVAAASSTSTFVGSYNNSATDFFSTGSGNESFVAGNGSDVFELNTVSGAVGPAHIAIFGFLNGDNVVGFGNDSANAQSDINSGTVTGNNLTITLSDQTTVTFVGVTSLTGHTIT